MQTKLADFVKDSPEGREADAILRNCVHCGFCNATCPTYQFLGDELDGPRGRIYLMKQMLEGQPVTARTQLHLDRCLSCRACETTCPSGVRYGRLADIGRGMLEPKVGRPRLRRLQRWALRKLLPYPERFGAALALARLARPILPATLRAEIPPKAPAPAWPAARHTRLVLMLEGCVQPAMAPGIDAAAANVLDRLGISAIRVAGSGCCGALSYHLAAHEEGVALMRRNIDALWPYIEQGAEAIVSTASGCGLMLKEYGDVLKHDPVYAGKAERVSMLVRDIGEILAGEDLSPLRKSKSCRIAFHSPCTLQHGQKLAGLVERLLSDLGFELTPVDQPHLCCGSAGTYALLQPDLSQKLLADKLRALEEGRPECIATANIGCWAHLRSGAAVPVRHWIELLPS